MAYNQYDQGYRQQPYQSQLPPQPQVRPQAAQFPPNRGGRPVEREERPHAAHRGQNGYNHQQDWQNGYPRQNGHWEEQSVQQSYPQEVNGYNGYGNANAEYHGSGQAQGRVYQYDERYHNDSSGNTRQNGSRQGERAAQKDPKQKAPQVDLKKSSKREFLSST